MDISVERLNNRMAMRLPAELPLGLVFVSGTLMGLETIPGSEEIRFMLVEAGYQLQCVMQSASQPRADLRNGMMVRAGGHLLFDPRAASYQLLARDLDVVSDDDLLPEAELLLELDDVEDFAATPILTELNRRALESGLTPAEVPSWVAAMAPAAVKAEMATAGTHPAPVADDPKSQEMSALNAELVAAISAALDKGEDVELTPEFLEQYVTAEAAPAVSPTSDTPARSEAVVAPAPAPPRSERGTRWMLALLLVNLIFLTAVVAAIVYVLFF